MRSTLFEDFDKRAQEVRRYFIFLKNLEQGSIQLSMGNTNNTKIKPINNDLEKTVLRLFLWKTWFKIIESPIV
jgi:hypothetical protein